MFLSMLCVSVMSRSLFTLANQATIKYNNTSEKLFFRGKAST